MKPNLLLAYHPSFLDHDSGPGHPEYPPRIKAVMDALEAAPFAGQIDRIEAREATRDEIALVHNPKYIEAMRRICEKGGEYIPRMEAAVSEASWPAALRAAGAGLTLADKMFKVQDREFKIVDSISPMVDVLPENLKSKILNPVSAIGFAPTRPPGHHATYERPMGFCIFNNISILAKYLQSVHAIERIAIVDFDVHHGNGTEEAFWRDPSVLYISLHGEDSYPYNKGRRDDSGEEDGKGFTLNVALPKGTHDREYLAAFDRYVMPKLDEFAPHFLLASAGFDAHFRDPLGGMKLTDAGYAGIGRRLKMVADNHCGGRIISLLEGGYDLQGLAGGVTAYLGAMLED